MPPAGEKPLYKIIYFDFGGRAEPARAMLTMSGVEFEDERISFSDWPALKPKTPLGLLPILETKEGQLVPTMAILNFLASTYGYHPKSEWDKAKSESVLICGNDLGTMLLREIYLSTVYKGQPIPDELAAKGAAEISKVMQFIENQVKKDTRFTFGEEITVADLFIYSLLEFISAGLPDTISSIDWLQQLKSEMKKDEKFSLYLKNRKQGIMNF